MLKRNNIYIGDVISGLNKIESNSVDLIIADPPYGIKKDKEFNVGIVWDLKNPGEWLSWSEDWLKESYRVLKDGGSIFVYGIHHNIGYLQTLLYDLGFDYGRMFIWHYKNGFSQYTTKPAATYEPLLWFTKGKNYTYHPIREPYLSTERLKNKIIKNGKVWTPNPLGKHGGDIWDIPTLAGKRFEDEKQAHPTQKPLALCDRIINHFSNPGDLVLAPFAGSGSECLSALNNDRDYIGIELNKEYVAMARKRLKNSKT
jgi:site-specific DNA-methyltransferase (adenine-specific)